MENNSEILNNNILYNDNYIQNYEELACCSNSIITTFIQENGANFLHYINDLCFSNASMDDEAQIISDPKLKLKTPLCSSKKLNKDIETNNPNFDNLINNSINNYINNIDNNNNNIKKKLNNSLMVEVNNLSNEEAPEPIVSNKKVDKYIKDDEENNNIVIPNKNNKKVNLNRNNSNIFNVIKEAFKDFFSEKKEEEEDAQINPGSEMNINLNKRPILKKIIEKDIITPLQAYENIIPQKNKDDININNILRHANSQFFRRPQLFSDDILSFNISEDNNNENLTKLVSFIPVFTVKKKIKSNEDYIRCTICLSEFEIGEKKSTLPCMHSFHCNCIERWIKKKNYCPICKFTISFENLKESLERNYK